MAAPAEREPQRRSALRVGTAVGNRGGAIDNRAVLVVTGVQFNTNSASTTIGGDAGRSRVPRCRRRRRAGAARGATGAQGETARRAATVSTAAPEGLAAIPGSPAPRPDRGGGRRRDRRNRRRRCDLQHRPCRCHRLDLHRRPGVWREREAWRRCDSWRTGWQRPRAPATVARAGTGSGRQPGRRWWQRRSGRRRRFGSCRRWGARRRRRGSRVTPERAMAARSRT